MEEALLQVATRQDGGDIAFNLTGGTKLMALAAQSVAEAARWRMFYVDLDTDEVIWLGRNAAPRRKLGAHLHMMLLLDKSEDRFLLLRLDLRCRVHTLGMADQPADPDYFYVG